MGNSKMNVNFFKVYIPNLSSERLKIPTSFSIHLKRETSRISFLTGPSGNVWTVSLTRNSDGYFFEEGWPVFVRDHLIKLGDICVFTYKGNSNFTVLIFDQSTCEKESAFDAICSQDRTCSKRDKGKKIGSYKAVKVPNASLYGSHQGLSKMKANMAAIVTRADLPSGYIISQRRNVTEDEKERAFKLAMEFDSNNPFTVIVMRRSYVYTGYCLPMPHSFKNFHLPDTSIEMILRDPFGKAWPVNYVVSTSGALSRGWSAFSYHNNIEEDDACVFELIRKNEMQVHIFRVVEKVTPLIKHSLRKRSDN